MEKAGRGKLGLSGFVWREIIVVTGDGKTWTSPDYQYNLADEVTSMIFPSGRIVTTTNNSGGQASNLQATAPYASSITYAPNGAIPGMKLGNNLSESDEF
jgi:hypothetical protein